MEKEVHAYELVYDAEAGIPSNSMAEPAGASVTASGFNVAFLHIADLAPYILLHL